MERHVFFDRIIKKHRINFLNGFEYFFNDGFIERLMVKIKQLEKKYLKLLNNISFVYYIQIIF